MGNVASGWSTPNLLGGNMQTVSVSQKFYNASIAGGYEADGVTPNALLIAALQFVDNSFAKWYSAVLMAGLADKTAFVVTAKHGQVIMTSNMYAVQ